MPNERDHRGRIASALGAAALLAGAFTPDLSVPSEIGIRYQMGWAYEYVISSEGVSPVESSVAHSLPLTIRSILFEHLPPLLPALFGLILALECCRRARGQVTPSTGMRAVRIAWLMAALFAVGLRSLNYWSRGGTAPLLTRLAAPEVLFQATLAAFVIGTIFRTIASGADVGRETRAWVVGGSMVGVGLVSDWLMRALTAEAHPHLTSPAWGGLVSVFGFLTSAWGTLTEFPGDASTAQRGRILAATGGAVLASCLILPWNVGRSYDTPLDLLLRQNRWWLDPEPSICLRLLVALPAAAGLLIALRAIAAAFGTIRFDRPLQIAGVLWLLLAALASFPLTPTSWSFRDHQGWEGVHLPQVLLAPLWSGAMALPVILVGILLWAGRHRDLASRLHVGALTAMGTCFSWQVVLALVETGARMDQWQSLSMGTLSALAGCVLVVLGTRMEFRRGGAATAEVEREFGPRWGHAFEDRFR